MMVDLTELLVDHRIGSVGLGDSTEDVVRAIGRPQDRIAQRVPEILKFGPVELGFYRSRGESESRLVVISVYFGRGDTAPDWLQVDRWPVGAHTTVDEFRSYLSSIGESVYGSVAGEANSHLVTDRGVRVSFVDGRLKLIQIAEKQQPKGAAVAATAETVNVAASDQGGRA